MKKLLLALMLAAGPAMAGNIPAKQGGMQSNNPAAHTVPVMEGTSAPVFLGPAAANSIIAGTGVTTDPAIVTPSAWLDAVFGSTQGQIIYRGASTWSALAPGTSGTFLETLGAGANPTWAVPSSGGLAWAINAATEYGVTCNGSTNDTTAINNALTAAAASVTRRIVQLPSGTCVISTLNAITASGVTLQGMGHSSTILKTNSATGDIITIGAASEVAVPVGVQLIGFSVLTSVTRTANACVHKYAASRTLIYDIDCESTFIGAFLDGTWAGTGNGDYNTFIHYSYFENNTYGIQIGTAAATYATNWPQNVFLDHLDVSGNSFGVYILNCGGCNSTSVQGINNGTGFDVTPGSGSAVIGLFSSGDQWDTSSGPGFLIGGTGYVSGVQVSGLWASSSTGSNGIGIAINNSNARGMGFENCHVVNNAQMGIWAEAGSYMTFTGCTVSLNSQATSGAHSGMEIASGASHVTVTGGRYGAGFEFATGATTNPQGYGIYAASTSFIQIQGVDSTGNISTGSGCVANPTGTAGVGVSCVTLTNTSIGNNL